MAVMSVVKLSELEGEKRIDAEYYRPEYLKLDQTIKKFNSYLLGQIITDFSSGDNLPQIEYKYPGKPYIRTQNVRPILIDKEGLTCVDPTVNNPPLVEEGDILFVRVGEGVGNSSIITDEWQNSSYSDNVIRIKIKYLDPYFVITYLNSEIGNKYLERVKRGSARSLISKENINLIKIFKPSHPLLVLYCKNTIKKSQALIVKSEFLYSQAESLLLEKLGLKDFKPKYELSYTANLSDALGVHRVDAEYFQPAYANLIRKMKGRIVLKPLRKFILSIQKGIEVGSDNYEEEGKPFIRVSNLSINGFTDRDQKYISEELYQQLKTTYEPKEEVFLLTKDATPGIAYIVKETVEGIISSGILKLKINDNEIDKEYLALCINSLVGKMQIERDSGGSVIIHWKPEQIKRLEIPILPSQTQQKIASLVQQSHEARRKAKDLLEIAKKSVEIAIEKNEKEALSYISKSENK